MFGFQPTDKRLCSKRKYKSAGEVRRAYDDGMCEEGGCNFEDDEGGTFELFLLMFS